MKQRAMAVAVVLATLASAAHAQVSCSDPDNLCTGDPCIIENVTLASSCVIDFGSRALVVRGTVHVPDGAQLSFNAGTITVEKQGRIDAVHGDVGGNAGDITLRASGGVDVSGRLDASGGYGHIGTIIVEAGGALSVAGRIRANAGLLFGSPPAGTIALRGAAGVTVGGVVEAKAATGGSIEVSSTGGDVVVNQKLRASSTQRFQSSGGGGGTVTVQAAGNVVVNARLEAKDKFYLSGNLTVSSAGGNVTVNRNLGAGTVTVTAAGDLTFPAGARNATILTAGGRAMIGPSSKFTSQLLRIRAASAVIGARLMARPTGEMRVRTTSGDLTLGGTYVMQYGGTIEATAAGNLTASGHFRATSFGCIALSAGGTLDTSGADFDHTVVADCPGSPSGAFID